MARGMAVSGYDAHPTVTKNIVIAFEYPSRSILFKPSIWQRASRLNWGRLQLTDLVTEMTAGENSSAIKAPKWSQPVCPS